MFKIGDMVRVIKPSECLPVDEVFEITEVDGNMVRLRDNTNWGWYHENRFVLSERDTEGIVSNPKHYTQGNIQIIDFIQDQKLNFALGNAIKYICRCNYKGTKEIDLKKAIQYLKFELRESE